VPPVIITPGFIDMSMSGARTGKEDILSLRRPPGGSRPFAPCPTQTRQRQPG
jgi:hypothetical protein